MIFKDTIQARIFLVNTEKELFYDRNINDIDYEDIIDELLDKKIKNKEFIINEI